MTKGEYRVGISFNPGGNEQVNKIKRAAADLIDLIDKIDIPTHPNDIGGEVYQSTQHSEILRLKALALTAVEEGAMWAVKAATKPAYEKKNEN